MPPGCWQSIDSLKDCGLLDIEPVCFCGEEVRPRDFFLKVIEPRLMPLPGDEDVCVMWNSAWGATARADCYMWVGGDKQSGMSAMARVTASCAAVAARQLAEGKIEEKAIVAPEDALKEEVYAALPCRHYGKTASSGCAGSKTFSSRPIRWW